jgi:hypothetical protein
MRVGAKCSELMTQFDGFLVDLHGIFIERKVSRADLYGRFVLREKYRALICSVDLV